MSFDSTRSTLHVYQTASLQRGSSLTEVASFCNVTDGMEWNVNEYDTPILKKSSIFWESTTPAKIEVSTKHTTIVSLTSLPLIPPIVTVYPLSLSVSNQNGFMLSGNSSFDPGFPQTLLTFSWECKESYNGNTCWDFMRDVPLQLPQTKDIFIEKFSLMPGTYNFILTVSKSDLSRQSMSLVKVTSGNQPTVALQVPYGSIVFIFIRGIHAP